MMNHFQTSSNNLFVDTKPPRVKPRSSNDARNSNLNTSSGYSNGGSANNYLNTSTNTQHRQANLAKPPHSPSPSVSSPSHRNSQVNLNDSNLTQRTHRSRENVRQSNSKRPDSGLSNQRRNSFLDDSNNSDFENENINRSKRDINRFLEYDEKDSKLVAKCIFNVNGKSADVEMDDKKISWKYITASLDEMTNVRRSGSGSKRNSLLNSQTYEMYYDKIFSIEPKRVKNSPISLNFEERFSLSDDYTIEGFLVHVFERVKPNNYQHRTITFTHPHRQTCKQWLIYLDEYCNSFKVEKRLLILLNPYAGEKRTRSILNFAVNPVIDLVNFKRDIIEFHDQQPLRDLIQAANINFNNYYAIMILSGDGSISTTLLNIMEKISQQEDDESHTIDLNKNTLRTPICLIASGTVNMVATSIYGTTNPNTPLMHLVYGNYINIDIASLYTSDHKLYNFAFGLSSGFGSDLVRYISRYSRLGNKKLQAALARGAAKTKRKPIEVEIKYLPCTTGQPCDRVKCVRGCQVCDIKEKNLHNGKTVDEVQEFDPLAVSINEIEDNLGDTYRKDYSDENSQDWKTVSGSFIHIALLTNYMLWDQAAGGGLSKYGHLGDGFMDLILVDVVSRKEFYRYIKRHANRKNQLDLPFVKAIRIKEAKIRIKNQYLVHNVGTPLMQSVSYTQDINGKTNGSNRRSNNNNNNNNRMRMSMVSNLQESDSDNDIELENFINKNFGSNIDKRDNDDDDDNDDNIDEDGGNKIKHRHHFDRASVNSMSTDRRKGPTLYYIQKNNDNNDTDDLDQTLQPEPPSSEMPTKSRSQKRSSSLARSGHFIMEKSRSIMNFFHKDDKMKRSTSAINASADKEYYDTKAHSASSSRTRSLQRANSFKTPFSWNIDWNLNPMPYLHIRCQKQLIPIFGVGLEEDTEFEESSKGCFPVF